MTDVTGFGLLGHLLEVCKASKLSAEIEFDKIPLFKNRLMLQKQSIHRRSKETE